MVQLDKLECLFTVFNHHFSPLSGNTPETKGTAFVIYEDIYDAKSAHEHLTGYSLNNRFTITCLSTPHL